MTAALRPILLATRNAGKMRELQPLLAAHGFVGRTLDEIGLDERPEESAIEVWDSFRENARAKARYFAALATDYAVLAEDSGLCVDILGGAPGVHSRRWGGEPFSDHTNNQRLLEALQSATERRAAYVCCAVLVTPSAVYEAEGQTAGRILLSPRGAGGFGYDPLFWSEELSAGFGEVPAEAKARVSHRTRAVAQVLGLYGAAR